MLKKILSLVHSKAKLSVYFTRQSWKGREKSGVLASNQKHLSCPETDAKGSDIEEYANRGNLHEPTKSFMTTKTACPSIYSCWLLKHFFAPREILNTIPLTLTQSFELRVGTIHISLTRTPRIFQWMTVYAHGILQAKEQRPPYDEVTLVANVLPEQKHDDSNNLAGAFLDDVEETTVSKAYRNDDPFSNRSIQTEDNLVDSRRQSDRNETDTEQDDNMNCSQIDHDISCDTLIFNSSLTDVRNAEHVHINTTSCMFAPEHNSSISRLTQDKIQNIEEDIETLNQKLSRFVIIAFVMYFLCHPLLLFYIMVLVCLRAYL
uniref:uncharacterized protein LOC120328316 isoform X1 n=1 Tax=Styela clava TaxID=7725 RepID=UPI00193A02C6|nr:uncharacterized protein LOC120328316 isoform X1 [Styela clava]